MPVGRLTEFTRVQTQHEGWWRFRLVPNSIVSLGLHWIKWMYGLIKWSIEKHRWYIYIFIFIYIYIHHGRELALTELFEHLLMDKIILSSYHFPNFCVNPCSFALSTNCDIDVSRYHDKTYGQITLCVPKIKMTPIWQIHVVFVKLPATKCIHFAKGMTRYWQWEVVLHCTTCHIDWRAWGNTGIKCKNLIIRKDRFAL